VWSSARAARTASGKKASPSGHGLSGNVNRAVAVFPLGTVITESVVGWSAMAVSAYSRIEARAVHD
jgi:hypothetical protein